jgi:hypothetical protein
MRVNQSISQGEEILMEKTPRDDEPLLGMIGNEQNDDELVAELRQKRDDERAFKQKIFLEKFEIENVIQDDSVVE